MILGSFSIYSDGVWRFSRDTGVPCPRSEVIQESVVGESWYWTDLWVLHFIWWSWAYSLSIQMVLEGFQEILEFRVPVQKLSNNLYWGKVDIGRICEFSILFDDLGLILYLFRGCLKVFKRYWSSVSPFRSYPTISIGGKLILDGSVSSPFYLMILGLFFIYSEGAWRFSRDTGVPCPHWEVIQQSLLGESWYWTDLWVLHFIWWSWAHSSSIQNVFEDFKETLEFHVPVQKLFNNLSKLEYITKYFISWWVLCCISWFWTYSQPP